MLSTAAGDASHFSYFIYSTAVRLNYNNSCLTERVAVVESNSGYLHKCCTFLDTCRLLEYFQFMFLSLFQFLTFQL